MSFGAMPANSVFGSAIGGGGGGGLVGTTTNQFTQYFEPACPSGHTLVEEDLVAYPDGVIVGRCSECDDRFTLVGGMAELGVSMLPRAKELVDRVMRLGVTEDLIEDVSSLSMAFNAALERMQEIQSTMELFMAIVDKKADG